MDWEISKLRAQLSVLKDVAETYPHATLNNVIQQIESRITEMEKDYGTGRN